MEGIKFDVKTLATYKGMSVAKLADECGINVWHLTNVSLGRVPLSAVDVKRLSEFTGINPEMIVDRKDMG